MVKKIFSEKFTKWIKVTVVMLICVLFVLPINMQFFAHKDFVNYRRELLANQYGLQHVSVENTIIDDDIVMRDEFDPRERLDIQRPHHDQYENFDIRTMFEEELYDYRFTEDYFTLNHRLSSDYSPPNFEEEFSEPDNPITSPPEIVQTQSADMSFLASITPHASIFIDSDDDFISFGFPGTGTEEDPYVIEYYEIITSNDNGIVVTGTTKSFVILNCYVDAVITGINVFNTISGKAEVINNICENNDINGIALRYLDGVLAVNNTCTSNWNGLFVTETSGAILSGNNCSGNRVNGINVENSYSVEVLQNEANNNDHKGIFLQNSNEIDVINNHCKVNSWVGLRIQNSHDVVVKDNTCENNLGTGISLDHSPRGIIDNNTCINNLYKGIFVENSPDTQVINNYINVHSEDGIEIYQTNNAVVSDNTCENNNNGIFVYLSNESVILTNNCSNNIVNGIMIFNSSQNDILGNICYENEDGMYLQFSDNIVIKDNICWDNYNEPGGAGEGTGISLFYCSDGELRNNTCNGNNYGFYTSYSTINILNNTCNNNYRHGLWVGESAGNTLVNNICNMNDQYGQVIINSNDIIVDESFCNNNGVDGIVLYITSNCTVMNCISNENGNDGISCYESSYSTLENCSCNLNIRNGIYLENSQISKIRDNNCYNNYQAISIFDAFACTVSNNNCLNNWGTGILLDNTIESTVSNNNCLNNGGSGIIIGSPISCSVSNNNCSNNKKSGISSFGGDSCDVTNNNCSNNEESGIDFTNIDSCFASNNNCTGNMFGIYLTIIGTFTLTYNKCSKNLEGILIDAAILNYLYYNTLNENANWGLIIISGEFVELNYNYFIDNNLGGLCQAFIDSPETQCNYNFWNDWVNPDNDKDGFVDIPYSIEGTYEIADYYPQSLYYGEDSDGDGLLNYNEVHDYLTDPLNADSDSDGIDDGDEILLYGTNPLDPVDHFTEDGSNIEIVDPHTGIKVEYEGVDVAGATTIKIEPIGPDPPANFEILGIYYTISASMSYTGIIYISIPYVHESGELPVILHWDSELSLWEALYTYYDSDNHLLIAETTSLSFFAIMKRTIVGESVLTPLPSFTDTEGFTYVTADTLFTLDSNVSVPYFEFLYYRINGGDWILYTSPFSFVGPDGLYTIEFYGVEYIGIVEEVKSLTVALISLEVDSYFTECPDGSFDVIFRYDNQAGVYELVGTNPGVFIYFFEMTNTWPIGLDNYTITLLLPDDFLLSGTNPIHIYLDGVDITNLCLIDGTVITISNIPAGSKITVETHLKYGLRGATFVSLEEFAMKNYLFEVYTEGVAGDLTIPGAGLFGSYTTGLSLIALQKKVTAIAGYIMDVDGNPLAGLLVELYDDSGTLVGSSYSDDLGFYYFLDLEPGDYELKVYHDVDVHVQVATAIDKELVIVNFVV